MIPPHWDEELRRIAIRAKEFAEIKPDAVLGVAVDDERKRDYFVPRLQKILDDHAWANRLTFRVVPVMGGEFIDLKRHTFVCDCPCPCGYPVGIEGDLCARCADGDCPDQDIADEDPDAENDFRRENPKED